MSLSLQVLSKTSDASFSELCFSGAILIFKSVVGMHRYCARADELIKEHFESDTPTKVQFQYSPEDYTERATKLRKAALKDSILKESFLEALEEIGLTTNKLFWDRLILRLSPHSDTHLSERVRFLPAHRDTWGSNIYASINLWAPIYPVTPERTICFYPAYWDKAIANNTADWDFEVIKADRKAGRPVSIGLTPHPTEELALADALPIVLEPGDLMAFSGAHLHASVPNDSGEARFSIDTRIVSIDDYQQGRAAINIDGNAPRVIPEWFKHVHTDEKLASRQLAKG